MEDPFDKLLQNIAVEPPGWDEEFYVSISKASELSGLSESQIRYLEDLPGMTIGRREGPSGRNRVYTKRDVKLLRWIYNCKDVRPAEIAQYFKEHQAQILERLEHVTLEQIIQHEQELAGHDVLISRLATLLLGIWRDAVVSGPVMEGIILGPADEAWRTAFSQSITAGSALDLAGCLVIWDAHQEEERRADLKILFSPRSWYLPSPERFIYDTTWFTGSASAFSVVIVWRRLEPGDAQDERNDFLAFHLEEAHKVLVDMLLYSLRRALDTTVRLAGQPVTVYSRTTLGSKSVASGLALLLKSCITPYFPDCYSYIARFANEELQVLEQSGPITAGYLPRVLDSAQIVNEHRIPWWITFAREKVSVALDRDTARRPERRDEEGSVVCVPLVGQDKVVGVLGLENKRVDAAGHCLAARDGIDGPALLRYLLCIAEIAADYLNLLNSSIDRSERSRLTYMRDESITWCWNIYQQSVWNYSDVIEEILDWIEQTGIGAEDVVDVILVDIAQEGTLSSKFKGQDIIINILKSTRSRIQWLIQNDTNAASLAVKNYLILFDKSVGDHIVLATVNTPKEYLFVLLERIRKFWQDDVFIWYNKRVAVSLQVGSCTFTNLGIYPREITAELMKHHLWEMARQMFAREPLEHLFLYDAVVITEKM